jgi:hypothetical protein
MPSLAFLFAVPVVGYILGPAKRKEMKKELAWVTLGPLTQFPEGETRLATYRNPFVRPGMATRQHSLLGAADFRRQVAGLRHQLHAPGLSGAVVSAIGIVHVPVSRRRVLCRWRARLRAAAARPFHVRLQN